MSKDFLLPCEMLANWKYVLTWTTTKNGCWRPGRREERRGIGGKKGSHRWQKFGPEAQAGTTSLPLLLPWYLGKRVLVVYPSISEHRLWRSKLIYVCSFPAGIVEIQTLSSLFILLKTTFGLKILFAIDGERIYIQLTSAWKRRTLGLCGTFNGNIRDDFL